MQQSSDSGQIDKKTVQKRILKIESLLSRFYGVPKQSAKRQHPLDVLIGTILSQNTNDKNSYKAFLNLKERYESWEEVADLTSRQLESLIKIAGLGKQKAKAILGVLHTLKETGDYSLNHLRKLPDKEVLDYLTAFDGVGVKTASCVLLFSLRKNVCPVDTHVNRTVARLGIYSSSNPEKTFWFLFDLMPDNIAHSFHTNLIRLGREFCFPTNPACAQCPLLKICPYEEKNLDEKTKTRFNDFMLLDNLH